MQISIARQKYFFGHKSTSKWLSDVAVCLYADMYACLCVCVCEQLKIFWVSFVSYDWRESLVEQLIWFCIFLVVVVIIVVLVDANSLPTHCEHLTLLNGCPRLSIAVDLTQTYICSNKYLHTHTHTHIYLYAYVYGMLVCAHLSCINKGCAHK